MVHKSTSDLPPGFRFHPTDEELIMYYLRNQATSQPCPVSIITEVDIYKFDPWQLPELAKFGEKEWYFFTPRNRRYPNGARPNRAAVSGYWKATGTDKAIYSGSKYVGVRKALVFYQGKPPKGTKTDWIMHEYRLNDSRIQPKQQNGSMRLDDWVLCRIYKKRNTVRAEPKIEDLPDQIALPIGDHDAGDDQMMKFPRTCSLSDLWKLEELGSISQLLRDNSTSVFQKTLSNGGIGTLGTEKLQSGEMPYQYADLAKFQMNQSSLLNQPFFVNPMFEFQ
ncbi:hypothetical protein F0562_033801 [Nyssa sinensis]|uniref:NAC domain-containing protein n=1 Tax=Nyssa sinensis TaxID=561372 RepID=A0A5J5AFP1_9ASTE|nr:hypothetical protein F0562_033801 [Nyssa sinensis]